MTYPVVKFDILTPCNGDQVAQNIAHARSLGLPEFDDQDLKILHIVANGPSAKLFDPTTPGPTLAVNGAGKLFNPDQPPTYWAVCDPQALVADFFKDPPLHTIYLVASKCDPLVFEMLKGRDVRLWHIDDHPSTKSGCRAVSVASSVTLCVLTLMQRFGFRHFETWGWDACFYDTEHHAGQHVTDFPENTVDLCVGAIAITDDATGETKYDGGRWFRTTSTWAAEGQDAVIQTHYADYTLTVHGDGLIKALLEARA